MCWLTEYGGGLLAWAWSCNSISSPASCWSLTSQILPNLLRSPTKTSPPCTRYWTPCITYAHAISLISCTSFHANQAHCQIALWNVPKVPRPSLECETRKWKASSRTMRDERVQIVMMPILSARDSSWNREKATPSTGAKNVNSARAARIRTLTLEPDYHTPCCKPYKELDKDIVMMRNIQWWANNNAGECGPKKGHPSKVLIDHP